MIRPGMFILQMLTDPDEGRFLQGLLALADGRRTLLEYADYLYERDEVRCEFLRLEHLLSATEDLDKVNPEQQARHRELFRLLAGLAGWLRIVKRTARLLNCGQASTSRWWFASGISVPISGRLCDRRRRPAFAIARTAGGTCTSATALSPLNDTPAKVTASPYPSELQNRSETS